jgi:hypothetical protein
LYKPSALENSLGSLGSGSDIIMESDESSSDSELQGINLEVGGLDIADTDLIDVDIVTA